MLGITSAINNLQVTIASGAMIEPAVVNTGSVVTLTGNHTTFINNGRVDPTLLIGLAFQTSGVRIGNTNTSIVNVTNNGILRGASALSDFNEPLASVTGVALNVHNGAGGTTTINNNGTLDGEAILGYPIAASDIPVIAVTGGGEVKLTNGISGTIIGRVALQGSARGNTFTNAGALTGSVSMGSGGGANTFNAVTGSSVLKGDGQAGQQSVTGQPLLTFAATGIVDGGVGGSNNLVLKNSATGNGTGTAGSGTVSSDTFINFSNLIVHSGTWTLLGPMLGAASTTSLNGGVLRFNNSGAFGSGVITGNGGNLQAAVSGLNLANSISIGVGGLTVLGDNSLALTGGVTGPGVLTKTGNGTLRLDTANTHASTVLSGGRLQLSNAAALGSGALTVGADATLENVGAMTLANAIQLDAGLTLDGSSALTLSGGVTGTGSLSKNGSGDLTLNGANSFTGGFNLNAGKVTLGNANALGFGTITAEGGTTLETSSSETLSNNLNLNGALTLSGNNDLTLNGVLFGSGRLVTTGNRTLTLNSANAFIGGITLGGGTLAVGNNSALGMGTLSLVGDAQLDATSRVDLNNNIALSTHTLTLPGTQSTTLSGSIIGSGALVKHGSSDLTLSGINAFSGGVDLQAGRLIIGNDSALGSGVLAAAAGTMLDSDAARSVINDITLAGDVTVAGSNDLTLDGQITGAGGLIKNGGATLTLGGVNTFLGNLALNAGTLQVDGSLASANVAVANGATLTGSGSLGGSVTIADGGHLQLRSGNVLTLGSLTLSQDSNVDAWLGAAVTGAPGMVNVLGDLTLDGKLNINNAGGFGLGVYRLFNYGGALTDNGLNIGALPSGTVSSQLQVQTSIANQVNLVVGEKGGDLAFWNGSKTNADGSIAGGSGVWGATTNWTNSTGSDTNAWADQFAVFGGQSGTVTLQGARAFSGMQFLSDGYRVVGAGGDNLSAINAADGSLAAVRVDAGMTAFIDAPLVGSGGIQKLDTGTLVLSGQNTYTGGTTITGGTLVGDTASLQGDILDNASLVFQQAANGQFNGTLSGTGAAFKRGAGTLLLTGSHGFSGDFTVEEGVLQIGENAVTAPVAPPSFARAFSLMSLAPVGDVLNANVVVAQGAGLTGTGSVASLVNHGSVLPGANGNLSVTGNFTNASDGTLSIALTPLPSSQLSVGGSASLAGRLKVLALAPYTGDTTYTLLSAAGGITGTFAQDNVSAASPLAFLDTSLTYGSNDVTLSVARNGVAFSDVALTGNQRGVAAALDSASAPASLRSEITSLDRAAAVAAFDSLSGEIHASTTSVLLEDSRYLRNTVNDRMRQSDCGNGDPRSVLAPSSAQQSSSGCQGQGVGWMTAVGGWSNHDATHAAASVDRDLSGFMLGFDNALNEDWRAGIAAGYTNTSIDAKQRNSDASVDSYHLATYLNYQADALAARLGAGYSWHSIDTKRHVAAGGYSDELKAKYKAGTAQVFGEVGYTFQAAGVALEPFAGLAYVNYDSDNGREKGGAGRLEASAKQDVTFSTVGLRMGKAIALDNGTTVTPRGSLGWRHAFGDTTPDADLRFIDGGAGFSTQGVPIAKDAAVVEAGFDVSVGKAGKLGLGYSGQLSSDSRDHAVTASFSLGF
ncbi:autotransporter domain-containing protein [Pseudomonas aegrilactucae]|uniref:Autotransporter domain-containing protein n=1 Tax=Pseudomonas aegrilactucae TaxID=2854028 RepID=A0A9Q3AG17_9PSED|nr:autotransporter domain-containing protein [Pseudomonas aegrilactucae]MBV6288935.1 autotransporter domain-containing protein [Pseudomonas aegrilactucae]